MSCLCRDVYRTGNGTRSFDVGGEQNKIRTTRVMRRFDFVLCAKPLAQFDRVEISAALSPEASWCKSARIESKLRARLKFLNPSLRTSRNVILYKPTLR